jgi:aspartyl-tRNA(Asn)/glutamyl-tRNA(Gln) amidotransferase subunit A
MRFQQPKLPSISNYIDSEFMPTSDRPPAVVAPGDDVAFLDAVVLAEAFRRRSLSPVEVARALISRIEALDPPVNAIVYVDRVLTLAQAKAAEARYAAGAPLSTLDGVPVTIKDLSAVAGWPRRRGSLALDPVKPAAEDTPCVARLREAGAVFLAKTATPEAGCRVVTRSRVHGVTANPYDLTKTPGGSSGGAAAALALGFGPLAVGSDGGGSIRIPASWTNVFGLKPGFGRVPAFPPDVDMPHSVVGPMSRTVADAALMLEVMARPEPRDPFGWPVPFAMPKDMAACDLSGLRIAISARLGCTAPLVDHEVDALVAEAGPILAEAGAEVMDESPIWPVDPLEPFKVFWETGCVATVDGFDAEKHVLLDPLLLSVAAAGRATSLAAYCRAQEQRMAIAVAAKAFFNRFDLLVGPVMPVPPYALQRNVPEGFADEDWRWCPYTYPWNMTGQPAVSVPIGFTASGLPVGVQIIGGMGSEANLLRAAAVIERSRPLHLRRPPLLG